MEAARKARLVGRATYRTVAISPFDIFEITPARERGWDSGKQLSEKQRAVLLKAGHNPQGMPYAQAKQLLDHQFYRWKHNLCTLRQAALLKRRGVDPTHLTIIEATKLIDAMAKREGWGSRR